ncbi:GNAT family N-acetyltransferase [Massilia sp. erpn]|uniref:GNAT family N-acetyltransferase n=1 Tax=Massilia sp. erpn TaxID=2738142 RepID=UPI002103A04C|nr:GNAT family N-acetyltransferase [Massilia sp. erpn]UTY59968.1 GNAT family N-acetyltransferase [Massilia sp. erpn]
MLPTLLRTQRLVLREPRPEDAAVIFESYTQDMDVARYMVWRPHTSLRQTKNFIEGCINRWESNQSRPYILALAEREDVPIGMLDALVFSHTVDIGYVLGREYWGTGLMPEAILAFCDAALALPDYFRIQATCDTENRPSARTLEKSGFKREGRLERYIVHPNLGHEPRASFMYSRCK